MIEDEPKVNGSKKFNRPFKAIDSEIYYHILMMQLNIMIL